MTSTRERYDLRSSHVNTVSKNIFLNVFSPYHISVQVDGDEENGFLRIDPSSKVTSLVDKGTDQLHASTLLSQEPGEGSIQAIIPTRRTISVPDSGDREDEPPSWILDALKVGTACAGQSFENLYI